MKINKSNLLGAGLLGASYYWLFALFLYLPILLLIVFSFNDSELLRFPWAGFTLRWYQQLAGADELLASVRNSLVVGLLSSLAATLLGTMAAIAIVRYSFKGRSLLLSVAALPLVIPAVVVGVALLILYRQVFDVQLSLWTVGLGHVVINIPIVILIVGARLAGFPANLEEAAMDLGASYWGALIRVTLPMSASALLAAFLTAFTTSFDEYAMSVFIVGSEATLPVYMYSLLRFPRKLPLVVALGAIIMGGSVLVILLAEWLRRIGNISKAKKKQEPSS
ncbi:MAG: ABC transporter permease [Anaerolineales bacterium]|nr:ABC transporter permease [Anaerolineales bacterium]